jgi:anti-sigma regulatory factor (Ser/Thr protein kinase)
MVAELLVSEAATNTLLHTNSGQPGGAFQVSYTISGQWLRVEVADQGAPTGPARRLHGPEALTGRGLELFDSLAPSWGVSESSDGRTVWFELDLHGVQLHSEQTEADTPGRVAGR